MMRAPSRFVTVLVRPLHTSSTRLNVGALVEAAATYDPVVDGPFSAYARRVVREAIQQSLRPS
jgi:hypothetical protein